MPFYIDEFETREDVKPLSKREKAWISRLEKTLKACPTRRLELVTIGDPDLIVVDGMITRKFRLDLHDGASHTNGVALAHVDGKPAVHAVSG